MSSSPNEEIAIQELSECLPIWLTKLQLINLLHKSNFDIIEAVSDFYERETEFHDLLLSYQPIPENQSTSLPIFFPPSPTTTNYNNNNIIIITDEETKFKNETGGENDSLDKEKENIVGKNNVVAVKKNIGKKKSGDVSMKKSGVKKKGKGRVDEGKQQPTITKFFGKVF